MTRETPSGCILAFRNDRLGGRLNAILTAMRLSRAYGTPFRVFWALTEASSPELRRPEELFSEDFIRDHFTTREEGSRLNRHATDIGMLPAGMAREDFLDSLRRGTCYLSNSATEQLLLPWEDASALEGLTGLLGGIGLNPRVREMIARIDARLEGVGFSSYHLRRGDIIDDAAQASHNLWPNKYIPRVIYEWHMKRELAQGDGRLVVFSDARAEAAAFAALSPRIFSFDDLIGAAELTVLQRDFLELYTMSRSERIFAPPSSAFSGMAAVIGNRPLVDIEASLTAGERGAALDELVRRLEDRPESFVSQSDAGQNFPFALERLDAQGQSARGTAIVRRYLEAGMDRAYAYSLLSERLLKAGDYEGCDRLVELAAARDCYREEHWSAMYQRAAMADMIRGDWARATGRFHVGGWFFPIGPLTAQTFWYMAALSRLTPADTYPFDPGLMRRSGRIYDPAAGPAEALLMERLAAAGLRPLQYPASMEVRDWRRVHGKKLNFRFNNRARIERLIELMAHDLRKAPDSPALNSALGALHGEIGDLDAAGRHLTAALDRAPDDPLYRKRHADLLFAGGQEDRGLVALEEACELAGGHPCYQAELALRYLDLQDRDRYLDIMHGLKDVETPLIEIRFLVIEALRRTSAMLPLARERIERLMRTAPGSHRIWALHAKVQEQLGHWDEALASIRRLHLLGRPDSLVRGRLSGLARAFRKAHGEARARLWMTENGLPGDLL